MIDTFRETLQKTLNIDSDEKDRYESKINPPTNAKPFDMKGERSTI